MSRVVVDAHGVPRDPEVEAFVIPTGFVELVPVVRWDRPRTPMREFVPRERIKRIYYGRPFLGHRITCTVLLDDGESREVLLAVEG